MVAYKGSAWIVGNTFYNNSMYTFVDFDTDGNAYVAFNTFFKSQYSSSLTLYI